MKQKIMDIKQKTLKYCDRMIAWAKTQPLDDIIDRWKMKVFLGESWLSNDSPYCRENIYKNKCKLTSMYDNIYSFCEGEDCCDGLWAEMDKAINWSDWIIAAKKVREYIKENG